MLHKWQMIPKLKRSTSSSKKIFFPGGFGEDKSRTNAGKQSTLRGCPPEGGSWTAIGTVAGMFGGPYVLL